MVDLKAVSKVVVTVVAMAEKTASPKAGLMAELMVGNLVAV
jgi:hypothetical protein